MEFQLICTIHRRKKELLDAGRRLRQNDEAFLHEAEKLLSSEFALVLNIPVCEIGKYIQSELNI